MNKLTKQLLSLGLSVVTVAGMVSPVLANDGVNVLKAQNSSTQTTKEGTKTIKLHIFKDGKEEPNPIDVEVPANADVFEIMDIIANNYVPTGYGIDGRGGAAGLYNTPEDENVWYMHLVNKNAPQVQLKDYKVEFVLKGSDEVVGNTLIKLSDYLDADKVSTDVEFFVPTEYKLAYENETPLIEKDGNGGYRVYVVKKSTDVFENHHLKVVYQYETREPQNFELKLNETEDAFGYIEDNYVPTGYKSFTLGYDFDKNGEKQWTLQVYKPKTVSYKVYINDATDGVIHTAEVPAYGTKKDIQYWLTGENDYVFYTFDDLIEESSDIYVMYLHSSDAIVAKPEKHPTDTADLLKNSLALEANKDLKAKYDEAVQNGATPTLVPVMKREGAVSDTDNNCLNKFAKENGYGAGNVFTIDVALVSDGETLGYLTQLSEPLTFKVEIPKELKKANRKFYVLRLHDGKVTALDLAEDGTFTTDQFSSYMLAYKDVVVTKPSTGTTTTKPATQTKKDPVSKKDPKKNKSVNTGVQTAGTFFTGLMVASVAGLGIVEVLKRRNK